MKVPFLDLSIQYKEIKDEISKALDEIYKRSDFILGKEVSEFEEAFAGYCSVDYAIGVNSGTDALFLSLKALDIKEGDEVIVPAFTYIASSFAISHTGARPVFCDIEEDTYNINSGLIEDKITENTKAVMVVHLYGHPVNMEPILDIARRYNLKVIEDCAQAHGAKWQMANGKWQMVGSIGDVGCFSFYPSKNLGAFGDAGMIVTNDKTVRNKLRRLRDYGKSDKYHHDEIGYNSRLDTIQAAILKVKLRRLDKWNELRRQNAEFYNELLGEISEIITPVEKDYAKHIYHVYAVKIRGSDRDNVVEQLKKNNIGVIVHYPIPLHLQKAYKELGYKKGDFLVSEEVASSIISLPMFPGMKKEHIEYVVSKMSDVLSPMS